jgi:hypothetical protein
MDGDGGGCGGDMDLDGGWCGGRQEREASGLLGTDDSPHLHVELAGAVLWQQWRSVIKRG